VLAWLAARRGESFDARACWAAWLESHAGIGPDANQMEWVIRLAQAPGPKQNDVQFTHSGWREHLASLSRVQ
jgi:hypothetical protein